jgi:hypothetical protein
VDLLVRKINIVSETNSINGNEIVPGSTLFVDQYNNRISWDRLTNKEIKFIPLFRISRLKFFRGVCNLEMEIKSAVVTKF